MGIAPRQAPDTPTVTFKGDRATTVGSPESGSGMVDPFNRLVGRVSKPVPAPYGDHGMVGTDRPQELLRASRRRAMVRNFQNVRTEELPVAGHQTLLHRSLNVTGKQERCASVLDAQDKRHVVALLRVVCVIVPVGPEDINAHAATDRQIFSHPEGIKSPGLGPLSGGRTICTPHGNTGGHRWKSADMVAVTMREKNGFDAIRSQAPKQGEDRLLPFVTARGAFSQVDGNHATVGKLEQRTVPLSDIDKDHAHQSCRRRRHSSAREQKRKVPPDKRDNSQAPGEGRPDVQQGEHTGDDHKRKGQ